eukprot:scaffold676074_cov48-Prasinocladus_malaysianus.AAC.1
MIARDVKVICSLLPGLPRTRPLGVQASKHSPRAVRLHRDCHDSIIRGGRGSTSSRMKNIISGR